MRMDQCLLLSNFFLNAFLIGLLGDKIIHIFESTDVELSLREAVQKKIAEKETLVHRREGGKKNPLF